MFRKVALLETLRSPILSGVQAHSLYASKNELLSFLKVLQNLKKNFQEVISNVVPYQNLKTCKIQLSAVSFFKTLEITSAVEFLSSEAGTNRFST